MLKHKAEIILLIILIPILAYVVWQAYNTYFKPPAMEDIEELEKLGTEEKEAEIPVEEVKKPPVAVPQQPEEPSIPKGTLDYTGFTERDPLRPALPVRPKKEKPLEKAKETPKETKKEPPKEIILPTFTITGIVWGKASPRAIIDNQVYKIGDTIKGAKILDITEKGIRMIYEEKEFWVNVQ